MVLVEFTAVVDTRPLITTRKVIQATTAAIQKKIITINIITIIIRSHTRNPIILLDRTTVAVVTITDPMEGVILEDFID